MGSKGAGNSKGALVLTQTCYGPCHLAWLPGFAGK